jgi:hypothetical protein
MYVYHIHKHNQFLEKHIGCIVIQTLINKDRELYRVMKKQILPKELIMPLLLVLLFNIAANLLSLYRYSYDAYTHIFLASHYMHDWLNLWETRWYGGFPVTSYPPLVHQLIALLSFLNGDPTIAAETSYQIMCMISAVFFIFSIYYASTIFIDKSEAKYAVIVASLLPSLYLTLYVYGQLPTIFASSFSFLEAYTFSQFLSNGNHKYLTYTALLSVLVASSHHFTFAFFLPLVLLLTLLMNVKRREMPLHNILRRTLIAFAISVVLVFIVMEPFLEFLVRNPFQVEIPHATRGNIFFDYSHALLFFWGIYGFIVVLIPVGLLRSVKRTEMLPLSVSFVFLFLIGLGGVTPLPKLILGQLWSVLTYDRFAVWASFLFTFLMGIVLKDISQNIEMPYQPRKQVGFPRLDSRYLQASLLLGLAASSVFVLSFDGFLTPSPVSKPVLKEVADFLENNGNYRYVTFGFGPSFMALSTMCSRETVDGGYNTARQLKILLDSGIERVDNAKYFPNGTTFLDLLLNKSQSTTLGIKWVIVADKFYVPILQKYGYKKMNITLKSDPYIEIWYRDDVTMTEIQPKDSFNGFQVAVWSFGPISALVAVLTLYVKGLIKRDEKN